MYLFITGKERVTRGRVFLNQSGGIVNQLLKHTAGEDEEQTAGADGRKAATTLQATSCYLLGRV
jgi:hypothetical protein